MILIRQRIELKYGVLLSVGNTAFERKLGVFAFVHMLLAAEKRYHDVKSYQVTPAAFGLGPFISTCLCV